MTVTNKNRDYSSKKQQRNPRRRTRSTDIAQLPAIGIWSDRAEFADSARAARRLREKR